MIVICVRRLMQILPPCAFIVMESMGKDTCVSIATSVLIPLLSSLDIESIVGEECACLVEVN